MATSAYIGAIFLFGGNFAPQNFMLCQGQLLPISQYTALFSILGTTYGGNGTTNFGLPDLRGRAPIGQGQGIGLTDIVLGETSGVESTTISTSNMPAHTHALNVANSSGNQSVPTANAALAAGSLGITHQPADFPGFASNNYVSNTTPNVPLIASTIGIAGSTIPIAIRNPYLAINYIICIAGVFPSRG